jgi:hypothetical protein
VRNFLSDRVWSPLGSRPHILLTANEALIDYGALLNHRARKWWEQGPDTRNWDDVVQQLPGHFLHITLDWLDRPTSRTTPEQWQQLQDELTRRFAALPPAEVQVGEPMVRSHALEVYIHPTPELNEIAAQARSALQMVFGKEAVPDRAPDKPWRPHLSTFYGAAEFDDDGLRQALVTDDVEEGHTTVLTMPAIAVLVDQDTFAPGGFTWDTTTATTLQIGG